MNSALDNYLSIVKLLALCDVTKIVSCLVLNYKNPHLDVIDRHLQRIEDKLIPDEASSSLELFYPPWVAGIDLPHTRCCGCKYSHLV